MKKPLVDSLDPGLKIDSCLKNCDDGFLGFFANDYPRARYLDMPPSGT